MNFGKNSKRRGLNNVIQLQNSLDTPYQLNGRKQPYYCSHFVFDILQRAELIKNMPEIEKKTKYSIPNLTQADKYDHKKAKQWIDTTLNQSPDILEGLSLKYDATKVSPQRLKWILDKHPELFEDVYRIVPQY